jgi:hypothetical protein
MAAFADVIAAPDWPSAAMRLSLHAGIAALFPCVCACVCDEAADAASGAVGVGVEDTLETLEPNADATLELCGAGSFAGSGPVLLTVAALACSWRPRHSPPTRLPKGPAADRAGGDAGTAFGGSATAGTAFGGSATAGTASALPTDPLAMATGAAAALAGAELVLAAAAPAAPACSLRWRHEGTFVGTGACTAAAEGGAALGVESVCSLAWRCFHDGTFVVTGAAAVVAAVVVVAAAVVVVSAGALAAAPCSFFCFHDGTLGAVLGAAGALSFFCCHGPPKPVEVAAGAMVAALTDGVLVAALACAGVGSLIFWPHFAGPADCWVWVGVSRDRQRELHEWPASPSEAFFKRPSPPTHRDGRRGGGGGRRGGRSSCSCLSVLLCFPRGHGFGTLQCVRWCRHGLENISRSHVLQAERHHLAVKRTISEQLEDISRTSCLGWLAAGPAASTLVLAEEN